MRRGYSFLNLLRLLSKVLLVEEEKRNSKRLVDFTIERRHKEGGGGAFDSESY